MAEAQTVTEESAPEQPDASLSGGAYEVIRKRLEGLNTELSARLGQLNDRRREVFGGKEISIIGNERVRTENNCVARDIISLGQQLVFGYNVFIGLRQETDLSDVFNVFEFDGTAFHQVEPTRIADATFVRDFRELYKFYKHARFLQFVRKQKRLLFIFQVGETIADIKVFRWDVVNDTTLRYIDDRGDLEFRMPPQHDFEWTATTRDNQVAGTHPHVSIRDIVFVECSGGDLTIKIENNTSTGGGIYAEPVEFPDQTLDDAKIDYALVGNLVLIRVLPYQETTRRHFIYNRKTEQATRIDALAQACVQLPEGHGVIFPRGYYLQDGTTKEFQDDVAGMQYLACERSPNGEDFLYIFYDPNGGRHILIGYNLISKQLANPIFCHGYALFDDGTMVLFNSPEEEPKRVHPMQIWQTPFYVDTHEAVQDASSFLTKIGNRDLVRVVSDCYTVSRLISAPTIALYVYQDLIQACTDLIDSYYWLNHEEVFDLKSVIAEIKTAGVAAVEEYDKVVRIRRSTEKAIADNAAAVADCVKAFRYSTMSSVDDYVAILDEVRSRRGHAISLRDLKYADIPRIEQLEAQLAETADAVSKRCVEFLLQDTALAPYEAKVVALEEQMTGIEKVSVLEPVQAELETLSERLDLLTDTVNNLKIEDVTQTTLIIDKITDVYAAVNRAKAGARNLKQELGKTEAVAEFGAQYKLLSQSITNYIGLCDTPAKCDEYLTKVMVVVEELEGRFADFEEFIERIGEKREEAYNAFSNRKQVLDEERQRRINNMLSSANRILRGIRNRGETFKAVDEVNGYFAGDLMVSKLRDVITRLQGLGDTVKADDLLGQLKTAKDDIIRRLRDKLELFDEGENLIKFGDYKFSVNTQPLELTTVLREDQMYFHLTGTDYYEALNDAEFLETRELWNQDLVSESRDVYRGEYLAYCVLEAAIESRDELSLAELIKAAADDESKLLADCVRRFAATRYAEGYEKGIHDQDATLILKELVRLFDVCALLRYDSTARAHAMIFWCYYEDDSFKARMRKKLHSYGALRIAFDHHEPNPLYIDELETALRRFYEPLTPDVDAATLHTAAAFLFYELQDDGELLFTVNALAQDLWDRFNTHLSKRGVSQTFADDLAHLEGDLKSRLDLVHDWVSIYVDREEPEASRHLVWEVVALVLAQRIIDHETSDVSTHAKVTDLLGRHENIHDQCLDIYLDRFLIRLQRFCRYRVPLFQRYLRRRAELTDRRREEMRLSEFESKVMGSFVRNKLINSLYLPMVGANFAKQLGAAGESKRTDLMGLLLLISPPGYGKTTLMEYVANRLGLTFMKVNGPAIGHQVTSLDPQEAPNATAREELGKLNLAFEMGNNIMIYLDDIQHCNPELLQKFISLCDAQRKIEGVYRGVSKTYDLRGKKVAVVMAGNPYTESGEKFQIPDMLANRADTYNLGDVASSAQDAFALSFIENSLTSNPVLSRLTSHSQADLYRFVQILDRDGSREGIEFDHNWAADEINEILSVLAKMRRLQRAVLMVNEQYIASAAQQDDYRTEPPFKMQGSYRNMNRLAEKVYPVMTDSEVDEVIMAHYQNESQTLTAGAEANLLKFKELIGWLSEKEAKRWREIKDEFGRRKMLGGLDPSDQMSQVIAMMSGLTTGLTKIRDAVDDGMQAVVQGQAAQPPPLDLSPVVMSIDRVQAAAAGNRFDLTPLVDALHEFRTDSARGDNVARFTEVLRNQVMVIESALIPVMERTVTQSDTFQLMRNELIKVLTDLEKILAQLRQD